MPDCYEALSSYRTAMDVVIRVDVGVPMNADAVRVNTVVYLFELLLARECV